MTTVVVFNFMGGLCIGILVGLVLGVLVSLWGLR